MVIAGLGTSTYPVGGPLVAMLLAQAASRKSALTVNPLTSFKLQLLSFLKREAKQKSPSASCLSAMNTEGLFFQLENELPKSSGARQPSMVVRVIMRALYHH
jgi:hypothetical protein